MRFLRLTLSPQVVSPSASVTSGAVINMQRLSDGTILELYWVEGDWERIVDELEESPRTLDYEVLGPPDPQLYIFHHGDPNKQVNELLALLNVHSLMIVFPIHFASEAGVTVNVIGKTEAIQKAYKDLPPEIRGQTTVEQIGQYTPGLNSLRSVLTERQREVLDAAVQAGYYSNPRTGTAEDVAALLDCAPSTASEHLRKIEAKVLSVLAVG